MRKVLSLLVAAVFMAVSGSVAFAAFTSVSTVKKTAKVEFTATGAFTWDIAIKNVAGDGTATEITWDAGSITPGTTGWANAQQYILITSTITDATSAIQIYTDNEKGTSFKYVHVGDTNTVSAGGLVGTKNPSAKPLPMAWSMKDVKISTTVVNPQSADNTIKYASLYFKDHGDTLVDAASESTKFSNGDDYVTILKGGTGWRWGGGAGDIGGSASGTFYMYIGADFSSASTPNTYGTDTLTFEGFTE